MQAEKGFVIALPRPGELLNREEYQLLPRVEEIDGESYLIQRTDGDPYKVAAFIHEIADFKALAEMVELAKQTRVRKVFEERGYKGVDFCKQSQSYGEINEDGLIQYISGFQERNSRGPDIYTIRQKFGVPVEIVRDALDTLESRGVIVEQEVVIQGGGKKRFGTGFGTVYELSSSYSDAELKVPM